MRLWPTAASMQCLATKIIGVGSFSPWQRSKSALPQRSYCRAVFYLSLLFRQTLEFRRDVCNVASKYEVYWTLAKRNDQISKSG